MAKDSDVIFDKDEYQDILNNDVIDDLVAQVESSLAIEGLDLKKEELEHIRQCLNGKESFDDMLAKISQKYQLLGNQ